MLLGMVIVLIAKWFFQIMRGEESLYIHAPIGKNINTISHKYALVIGIGSFFIVLFELFADDISLKTFSLPYRKVQGSYFNLLLLFILLMSNVFILYVAIPYNYFEIVCLIVLLRHTLIFYVTLTYLMIHGGKVWNEPILGMHINYNII
jgi:hypothetical protein